LKLEGGTRRGSVRREGDGNQLHGDVERARGPAAERRHQGRTSGVGTASRITHHRDEHQQETAQGSAHLVLNISFDAFTA